MTTPVSLGPSGWRNALGLERNLVVLLVSLFLMGFSEELWVGFVPKRLGAFGAGALVWTATRRSRTSFTRPANVRAAWLAIGSAARAPRAHGARAGIGAEARA